MTFYLRGGAPRGGAAPAAGAGPHAAAPGRPAEQQQVGEVLYATIVICTACDMVEWQCLCPDEEQDGEDEPDDGLSAASSDEGPATLVVRAPAAELCWVRCCLRRLGNRPASLPVDEPLVWLVEHPHSEGSERRVDPDGNPHGEDAFRLRLLDWAGGAAGSLAKDAAIGFLAALAEQDAASRGDASRDDATTRCDAGGGVDPNAAALRADAKDASSLDDAA
eukprot:gene8098-20244_t